MKTTAKADEKKFPVIFEHNGRTGKIYRLGNGTYKTRFYFAQKEKANTHGSYESACEYLRKNFEELDNGTANAAALNPLRHSVQTYSELERQLAEKGGGKTLGELVRDYLATSQHKQFKPAKVADCADLFIQHQEAANISGIQIKTLKKHFKRFTGDFGNRNIDTISSLEITNWLATRKDEKTGKPWSVKTRKSNRGSLVSLSLYAQDILKAIPDNGETEFQKVKNAKQGNRKPVEIYKPDEIKTLLLSALENDIDMIPALVCGNFLGLRPNEFHGEESDEKDGAKELPLAWEQFNWGDKRLHITRQKVRSKANRDVPIQSVVEAWLEPFKGQKGAIWKYKKAYLDKLGRLRKKTGIESLHDGFRHSYASYRIRQLKQDLPQLAAEMGNSPQEILNSYKRNVSDADAKKFFSIMPPKNYAKLIKEKLGNAV